MEKKNHKLSLSLFKGKKKNKTKEDGTGKEAGIDQCNRMEYREYFYIRSLNYEWKVAFPINGE